MTLVEVIVSVAIVGLLAGLLLPALSGARAGARSFRCRANLRQLATALTHYVSVFDAHPPALRYEMVDGQLRTVAWDWTTTFAGELIGPGPLWQFTDSPGDVQQCPDYHGDANFSGDPHSGYNYNTTWVGGEATAPIPGWDVVRGGVRPAAVRRGSSCAAFGCGGYGGGANKFMRSPENAEHLAWQTIYAGGQAFRHRGTTNVACLDGHVEALGVPHDGAHATDALRHTLGFPDNGFLSDDASWYDPR